MVFRIPSQFDSFVASPSHAAQPALHRAVRPWRGALIVPGLRNSNREARDYIHVSAVETDGENRIELWPREFHVVRLPGRQLLRQVMSYVQHTAQPTCNFLPERLNPEYNEVNRANFRALSRQLHDNQEVVIAPWGQTSELGASGAGIIIYPASNSGAYLIGAIFDSTEFPDFMRPNQPQPPPLSIPGSVPGGSYPPQGMGPPSSPYSAHTRHPHSGSPRHSHPNSPTEHPSSGGSYRPIIPRDHRSSMPHGAAYPNLPSGSGSSPTNTASGSYSFHPQNPPFP
ncbi:hypothetical protein FA15DRAFT_331573 [Coprinopsis marcescibilis]|uniref:Uncharacterized protein n=1 Tax=Coprinopsis marcescibilis TaxID=230819 RepID=A0A5C3KBC2_COPMA|nr:hypothetical protein FA15DRAFT_331573 [Coprinopsis marcescibilis]